MAKQTVSTNASSQIKSPRANFTEKLIYSATKGYLEDLISVLEQGANVDMKDELGNTALHMAAAAGHTPIVKKLLENNANVNIQNNQGNTPLHQATWRNHPEIVKMLLNAGARVDVRNQEGKLPTDWATTPELRAIFGIKEEKPVDEEAQAGGELEFGDSDSVED
jgi:ankyrin repeat protein